MGQWFRPVFMFGAWVRAATRVSTCLRTEAGLFLGRKALIERRGVGYAIRPRADLEQLLGHAYCAEINLDRLMPGLGVVASALGKKNLCLAQIAAVQLRMPDLPDSVARQRMEAEDLRIKLRWGDDRLARSAWDPTEHPRGPGFRPIPAGSPRRLAAQRRPRSPRAKKMNAPEEMLDPTGPLRQAQWDAAIATLRQIDPGNPQLSSITAPGWVPRNQDIARINAEISRAVTRRVTDFVMPGGHPIGATGGGQDIRVVEGGATAARKAFDYLSVGGTEVTPSTYAGTLIQLPGNAGYVGLRASDSGPAVDINVSSVPYRTLHYP